MGRADVYRTDATDAFDAVTSSDTVNHPYTFRRLYIGGAGTVRVVKLNDDTVDFTAVAGGYLDVVGKRVDSTGTSATGIVAFAK